MRFVSMAFLSACMFWSHGALANSATEYDKLQERLLSGKPTFSVVDLSKCTRKDQTPVTPALKAGFRIDSFRINPGDNPIITYTRNNLSAAPDGTPVILFLQYQIAQDDTATITFRRLAPDTYKDIAEPRISVCKLGVGVNYYP